MSSTGLPTSAKQNIETIKAVERELLNNRSVVERVGIHIAAFFGSFWFICAHAVFFAIWILFNAGEFGQVSSFDPFPFPFLALVIGVEFFFLTTFVLMNQHFQASRQERWSHLILQLSMLSELEVTKNMQLLDQICQRLDITTPARDQEIKELAKNTSVEALMNELDKDPISSDS